MHDSFCCLRSVQLRNYSWQTTLLIQIYLFLRNSATQAKQRQALSHVCVVVGMSSAAHACRLSEYIHSFVGESDTTHISCKKERISESCGS